MLTIPNVLTLLRAAGIPIFLFLTWQERYSWAVLTLMIAGATDYFDGKLARALNQESRLGELLDPAVDRLYIATVLIAMFITGAIPIWVLVAIVARDLILGVLLLAMKRSGLSPFKVTYLGKAATFNLLYALPLLLLTFSTLDEISNLAFIFGWAFAGWGIGLYLWTGAQYARTGLRELRARRNYAKEVKEAKEIEHK
jgi:cardiolipin synthase